MIGSRQKRIVAVKTRRTSSSTWNAPMASANIAASPPVSSPDHHRPTLVPTMLTNNSTTAQNSRPARIRRLWRSSTVNESPTMPLTTAVAKMMIP